MKKVLLFLIIISVIFSGCTAEKLMEKTAVVTIPTYQDFTPVTTPIFEQSAKNIEINIQVYPTTVAQQLETVTQLINDESVTALVVCVEPKSQIQKMLELASQANKPIIFYGDLQNTDILKTYDKCWYVGAVPQLKGETLGQMIYDSYEQGYFVDKNKDLLLQYVSFVTNDIASETTVKHTVERIENNGLFSQEISQNVVLNPQDAYAKTLEIIDSGVNVEAFICANSATAQQVKDALSDRGIFNSYTVETQEVETEEGVVQNSVSTPASFGIFCADFNQNTTESITNGEILGTVMLDEKVVASTALQIAQNAITYQNPLQNIDYPINENKVIYLPYLTVAYTLE